MKSFRPKLDPPLSVFTMGKARLSDDGEMGTFTGLSFGTTVVPR
jgi:hypothetical protein